ncbi:hypothetical protein D046_7344, partial [Vibrio parahaemolyticus V-223/04]|jgi:hypothetical protein
MRLSK